MQTFAQLTGIAINSTNERVDRIEAQCQAGHAKAQKKATERVAEMNQRLDSIEARVKTLEHQHPVDAIHIDLKAQLQKKAQEQILHLCTTGITSI